MIKSYHQRFELRSSGGNLQFSQALQVNLVQVVWKSHIGNHCSDSKVFAFEPSMPSIPLLPTLLGELLLLLHSRIWAHVCWQNSLNQLPKELPHSTCTLAWSHENIYISVIISLITSLHYYYIFHLPISWSFLRAGTVSAMFAAKNVSSCT